MKSINLFLIGAAAVLLSDAILHGEIQTVVDHNANDNATTAFKFKNVPPPSGNDAANQARFTLVDGDRDENGGGLAVLHDGKVPAEGDEPGGNFFFRAGTDGGRLLVDLERAINVRQVNTYSWHPTTRGPQVYQLYAADGSADGFQAQPKKGLDPSQCGWKLITKVDTRPKAGEAGGQHGVSISNSDGIIGSYRYLLFDISQTEADDAFGNTFYSEIDVIDQDQTAGPVVIASEPPYVIRTPDSYCEISIDTAGAPGLKEWAERGLAPVLAEWYPKIVALLPSEGYAAPKKFSVTIRPGRGVAATGGTRVTANSNWLKNDRNEINAEAIGAIVHEAVHVVQQYHSRRSNPEAPRVRPPGWLVEGIPDYIRWFLYEPQSHGADLTWVRARRNLMLRYDAGYRISANFLNWVSGKYDRNLVTQLNAALRDGKYQEELWKEYTGHTVQELGAEWQKELQDKLASKGVSS